MTQLLLVLLFLYCTILFAVSDVSYNNLRNRGGIFIVNGSNVSIDDFPYLARLVIDTDNSTLCGGSIISATFILTAAHCLIGLKNIHIRVGSEYADGGNLSISNDLMTHPNFDSNTKDCDVALVRLSSPLTLGDKIKPISLPNRGVPIAPGTNITVSGWGDTSENGEASDRLMAVIVPTVSNAECRESYKYLTENMFCAGLPEGGKDSCQGDSGGPAVTDNNQIGIVSFGEGCARPLYPGVYTRVASPIIRDWIKENAGV